MQLIVPKLKEVYGKKMRSIYTWINLEVPNKCEVDPAIYAVVIAIAAFCHNLNGINQLTIVVCSYFSEMVFILWLRTLMII